MFGCCDLFDVGGSVCIEPRWCCIEEFGSEHAQEESGEGRYVCASVSSGEGVEWGYGFEGYIASVLDVGHIADVGCGGRNGDSEPFHVFRWGEHAGYGGAWFLWGLIEM